jgi:hypothetical protein
MGLLLSTFTLKSTHFIFNKCPIYTHDGASVKFSTNSHETDYSVVCMKYPCTHCTSNPLSTFTLTSTINIPPQCPSADYSQSHYENVGNFLRRLAFRRALTYVPIDLRPNSLSLTRGCSRLWHRFSYRRPASLRSLAGRCDNPIPQRLNMELDLRSLFGLHVHSCTHDMIESTLSPSQGLRILPLLWFLPYCIPFKSRRNGILSHS